MIGGMHEIYVVVVVHWMRSLLCFLSLKLHPSAVRALPVLMLVANRIVIAKVSLLLVLVESMLRLVCVTCCEGLDLWETLARADRSCFQRLGHSCWNCCLCCKASDLAVRDAFVAQHTLILVVCADANCYRLLVVDVVGPRSLIVLNMFAPMADHIPVTEVCCLVCLGYHLS